MGRILMITKRRKQFQLLALQAASIFLGSSLDCPTNTDHRVATENCPFNITGLHHRDQDLVTTI